MSITISILQYNNSRATIRCLKSLVSQMSNVNCQMSIVVVDNNSAPEEAKTLRDCCQNNRWVQLIENGQNLGFSGGNNAGIRQALQNGANWVVLLNNDTWVENDFVSRLRAILGEPVGILGIPLDEGKGVAYAGKVQWLRPTLKHEYVKCQMSNVKGLYAIGAGIAIHKSVFEKIGYLDEKYFLYFEDADFSVRARKAGIPILFAPDLVIHHSVSQSTKSLGSPLLLRYHYRNALYFNRRNGPWWVQILLPFWSLLIMIKQLIKLATGRNREESRAILNGMMGFLCDETGKIK